MSIKQSDPFDEIRPYHDYEVRPVIERLLNNRDLLAAVTHFKFPRLAKYCAGLLRPMVRKILQRETLHIHSISQWQNMLAPYMEKMIDSSITKLTFSGLDKLIPNRAYLFISNHRDISMDPAFVNYGLYYHGLGTVRIAIGDNLLCKPYIADIMRLNKSFIVRRSVQNVREMITVYSNLSAYIDQSINEGHSIWIAQSEGRAKDGLDKTDPAMMKMLYMHKKKTGMSLTECIAHLHIVPVSISYQFDPCDIAKAKELYDLSQKGNYIKNEFEDIASIVQGIIGFKGCVHVAFGDELSGKFTSPDRLAETIDQQIISNYYLHPSNHIAYRNRYHDNPADIVEGADETSFTTRFQHLSEPIKTIIMDMYANPVVSKQQINN